jgi:hypothetical protein
MTTLTPAEKQAGRAFRDARQAGLDARNAASPPGEFALAVWRVFRHECPESSPPGGSIGIVLRERYESSPAYGACYCGVTEVFGPEFPHWDCDGSKVYAADGLFAWIWKEGACSGCGLAVRSKTGRVVLAADRPPDHGRADGGQAGAHNHDPRLARA